VRLYLAARYSRRAEVHAYGIEAHERGHSITSRWLRGDHQIADDQLNDPGAQILGQRYAEEDLEDLAAADLAIFFTEEPRAILTRGGRHVEFGLALAGDIPCWIVGPRENVFHCLPEVRVFPDWKAARSVLESHGTGLEPEGAR